MCKVKNKGKVK